MNNDQQLEPEIAPLDTVAGKIALQKLTQFARPYWPWLILTILITAISSIMAIVAPHFVTDIVDYISEVFVTGAVNFDGLWRVSALLIAMYVLVFLFDFTSMFTMTNIAAFLTKRLRTQMNDKVDRVPLAFFDGTTHGDVLSRITNDVRTLESTLNQSFVSLVASIIMFIGSLVMMFAINWIMTLVALGGTLIGFVLMAVIGGSSQKYFAGQQKELGALTGHIEEVFTGHDVVVNYSAEASMKAQFKEVNDRLYANSVRAQFTSGVMMPLMFFVGNLSFVLVFVAGAILLLNGDITFGVIASFMIYIGLFTRPLGEIAGAAMTLQATVAASGRIFGFLEEAEMADESKKSAQISAVKGDVTFDEVQFAYVPEKPIINHFSARVKAGQKVAIVGPTGAGKTTIVNLLMRFYELNGGAILVDGVNIAQMKREQVYDLFTMVLQDTWLFEGSIKDNLAYNKEGVTYDDCIQVCKAVGLHHYIKSLPDRYDTLLTDKVNLSVGQRQLMTIARAMISDAPLLILDEATSSVDTRTEILIQQAMDKLTVGRTSFVIAHRLSTIKNADLILVMDKGDVIESGTHDQLLAVGGFYANLYNAQFEVAV